ncbi:nicotinate (nicotinamide) nucleotide adenylyltransferase [Leptospira yasudae]|uniref:Probable nicotinate-nucleotide adenylyltransferase n=1 Tax=Leptospira yasudae TaxID=2202201 RepID=A0A6N4QHC6_9LEPT|nr:nicotinate (nicotinamide) nucleotide adenylyltransferase [Leptospira yasudae]TGL76844.1 nicotinate (nicotinamide) nucleotide adenylyltransferase [Leptospira yasudae]TGL79634.1 nicotinate (nicotinamide) nucleotide adenylyltransferase [Leptospira yasudae]TGL82796.1 nicotinate (nicotinamide) nucleotide adenylyltransferase [Leptospira yasudae]
MSGESQILTGIFGGSFDPPHIGHSGVLKSFFQEVPECKEVFLIPNRQNPLKNEKRTSSETILEMSHIFVSEFRETIRILDLELKRTGPSFTIQTILELKTSYPNREFVLLIGEDNYSNFHQWKDWKEILNHVHEVFVFRRFSENVPMNDHLSGKGRFRFLNNPLIPVSSTDLRISFAKSDSAAAALKRERLSENILAYIEKNGLYRK